MTNQPGPSLLQEERGRDGLWLSRTLAILLMIAGAAGFFVSLIVFRDQVLCLVGSTLVVFAGLMVNILIRQRQMEAAEQDDDRGWQPVEPGRVLEPDRRASSAPARQTWSRPESAPAAPERSARQSARPIPARQAASQQRPVQPAAPRVPVHAGLTGRVSEVLRRQGAQVRIEARRENRTILQVRTPSGETYTALILEGPEVVDVSEVRGLYGLMTASGSIGAFMVSGGSFTPQARSWARQRSLTLMEASQVEYLLVD